MNHENCELHIRSIHFLQQDCLESTLSITAPGQTSKDSLRLIEDEKLNFAEFKVVVEKMRGHRIIKLKIIPKPKPKEESE